MYNLPDGLTGEINSCNNTSNKPHHGPNPEFTNSTRREFCFTMTGDILRSRSRHKPVITGIVRPHLTVCINFGIKIKRPLRPYYPPVTTRYPCRQYSLHKKTDRDSQIKSTIGPSFHRETHCHVDNTNPRYPVFDSPLPRRIQNYYTSLQIHNQMIILYLVTLNTFNSHGNPTLTTRKSKPVGQDIEGRTNVTVTPTKISKMSTEAL